MVALQAAGTDLAANQTARLLAEPVVAEHAATVAANWQPALLLLVLVVAALLVSITLKRTFALGAAALYAAGAVAVVSMGMAAVAPLLILGAVVLAGLTTVPYMFDRARALSEF
jgi:hypothetical protein